MIGTQMKKRIIYCCIVAVSCFFIYNSGVAKSLTNLQINMLLENDDIQIFTSQAIVKKSSVTTEQSTDNSQDKVIVEYDKKGLLINYYNASVVNNELEQTTMITTMLRLERGKWQRKQTVGSYEIDNSLYELKDGQLQITYLPSHNNNEEKVVIQQPIVEDEAGNSVLFQYAEPIENESLDIQYQFDKKGLFTNFHFSNINKSEYSYSSTIQTKFEYDEQDHLIKGEVLYHYQFLDEPADSIVTDVIYSDFDQYGNWRFKVEYFGSEKIIYKRDIEYWN